MSGKKLITRECQNDNDIRTFFDESAAGYHEQHGNAQKLLRYRIGLIRRYARPNEKDTVLDIGCGPGHHLMAIASEIKKGIGVDFSPEMIRTAQELTEDFQNAGKLLFQVDDARYLSGISANTIDLVICIGALEHMTSKPAVIKQIQRVLKEGGRMLIMTLNSQYIWYTKIAPKFGLQTRHLSTDRFLSPNHLQEMLNESGFDDISIRYWTFIPKGDMHFLWGSILQIMDVLAKILKINTFRGGLLVTARK